MTMQQVVLLLQSCIKFLSVRMYSGKACCCYFATAVRTVGSRLLILSSSQNGGEQIADTLQQSELWGADC